MPTWVSADGNAGQHQPSPFCFPVANAPVSTGRKEKQDLLSAPGLDKAAAPWYYRVQGAPHCELWGREKGC